MGETEEDGTPPPVPARTMDLLGKGGVVDDDEEEDDEDEDDCGPPPSGSTAGSTGGDRFGTVADIGTVLVGW